MTRRARAGLLACLTTMVVVAGAMPARAHALLSTASPASGQRLEVPPDEVRITFTEPIDTAGSSIAVLSASGASVGRGPVKVRPGLPNDLVLRVGALADGVYTVTWRVLSRIDGHVTGGAYAFGVRADPSAVAVKGSIDTQRVPLAGVASRTVMYLGIFLLIGLGALAWIVPEQVAPRAMAGAGVMFTMLGIAGLALAQRADAGVAWRDLLGSSVGTGAWRRALPLAIGLASARMIRARRPRATALAAGAAGVVVAHSAFGHAGAMRPALLAIALQSLHVIAAAAWIGGLVAILAVLRRFEGPDRTWLVRRYSALALILFVVVAGLGSVRAVGEVGSWRALFATGFGRLVLFKIVALVALGALGAVNRFRNVARVQDRPRSLAGVARVEVALAALVLIATGLLSSLPPSRTFAIAEEGPNASVVTGTDFARTVSVSLSATPGATGPNRFDVRLTNPVTGKGRDADSVSLRFRYGGPSPIEPANVLLARAAFGRFTASSSAMAVPGPWRVTVTVTTGTAVVEVPLIVATVAEQTVRTIPGAQPISDITLADGRVQLYVTPGAPGRNEVHATFFTAGGREDSGMRNVRMVATDGRQRILPLTVRTLSPGHFVANGTLEPGRWRFDVFATKRSEPIWAYVSGTIGRKS